MASAGLRRLLSLAVLCSVLVLTACSPDSAPAVGRNTSGRLFVIDCGEDLVGLRVVDDASGRVIWSAGKRPGADVFGVARIDVGAVPAADWNEVDALAPDPLPAVWRFEISRRGRGAITITVPEADVAVDLLRVAGRRDSVPLTEFEARVCG